jgi:hypothetical protein
MVLVAPFICMVLSQAPTAPLAGIVVGPNGEPVAGAEVLLAGLPVFDPTIVARGQSDARGRFTLERLAGLAGESRWITPILWVVKPGFRLASVRFPGAMPGAGEPVRVPLGPRGNGEVRVEGPGGEPLAGARIRLEWFGPDSIHVPEEVEDLVQTTTDQDGRAVLDAAANNEIAYVDVHAKGFGIQGRPFVPVTSNPKRVRLRPVGSLEGRLQADDPAIVKGWRVSAYTYAGDRWSPDPPTTGFDKGTTDAEGRFTFPVIAPGSLQLELKPPRDLPVLADVPNSMAVVEGRRNTVVVPLRKAVIVTGVVRERGTGRPVPAVELSLFRLTGGQTFTGKTDAQGRYTFSTLPGKLRIVVFQTPPSHVIAPGQSWADFSVDEGSGRVELESREAIPAAPPLRFAVRDEAGRPVPHAAISGRSSSRWIPQTTDDRGEFAVAGLAPGDVVSIEVRREGRMTDGPVQARAGTTETVPITIVPGLALALSGRVVRPGGTPVAEAVVRVQYREKPQAQGGLRPFPETLGFGDRGEIRTGTDGTFRTPKEIYRKNRDFRVEVIAAGYFGGKTDWVSSEAGELITLPDLVLLPRPTQRAIAGRVVDRGGKGIAAVSVFHPGLTSTRTASTTDREGRFRLDGVVSGSALVFAEKAGFRFGGAIVGPGDAPVQIRLARAEEPPLEIRKATPPPLSRGEERAMARELLAPLIEPSRSGSLGFFGQSVVPALARVDPDRVLEMLENRALPQAANLLHLVALAQSENDPGAAIATIEADRDPAARAGGFLKLADATHDAERALRLALIDRVLAEADRVPDKEARLGFLGAVADRWIELGLFDRAKPVIHQGRSIIATLPREQFSFAAEQFAEVLAVIDLRTARSLFERKGRPNVSATDPGTIQRHLGEAALCLAALDPAAAERLVADLTPNYWDDTLANDIFLVCQRMARMDLPRARRILDTIDKRSRVESPSRPALVPKGLGLMAAELAETDPAGARRLLDEALDRLRQVAGQERPNQQPWDSNVIAALLPVVERIDPDRLEERLWLAAACAAPMAERTFPDPALAPVVLAALVARYDRAMAEALIAPVLPRLPGLLADPYGGFSPNPAEITKALAAYDPRAVTALLRDLPASARRVPEPKNDWNRASLDTQVRLAAAEALGLPVNERYRQFLGGILGHLPSRRGP